MRNETVKILYVNGGLMDRGGISAVMMSYFLHMDAEKIHIDFLVHGEGEGIRDNEILKRGSKIFNVIPKSKNPIKNQKQIEHIIVEGKYDIVHSHADSGNAHILKIAKKCGVKVRISHSHNTNYTITNNIRILLNDIQKKSIKKYATHLWACSEKAAYWLYGTTNNIKIIRNAIEVEKYLFSEEVRKKIRTQYGIVDKLVIGIVGRLDYQKNHKFAIDLMRKLQQLEQNIKLLVVGDGILRDELISYAGDLVTNNRIIFCGQVDDVEYYYSAFDLLIMPSKFEGLPVSTVEAQCNGLTCVLANTITTEVKVNENVYYLGIEEKDINAWSDVIMQELHKGRYSINVSQKISEAGFDIIHEAAQLQDLYQNMVREQ